MALVLEEACINKRIFSYDLHRVKKIKLNNIDIKSSVIRNFIKKGKVKAAGELLGRLFSIDGKVVRGKGLGTKLSTPTANIQISNSKQLTPKNGVYHTDLFITRMRNCETN